MSYFASDKVNVGRQPEIDFLKAFCILCMIVLHIYEDCVSEPNGILYELLEKICSFTGAATFMICMGIGMCYSRQQDSKSYLIRGLELLTVGQFLNLLRNAIPNLIAYWFTGKQIFIANSLLVIQADILTFAGFAFLFMSLLKKLNVSALGALITGFILNVAVIPLLSSVPEPSNFLLSQLMAFFVITKAEAFFPFTSYFIFVAFGYFIGGKYPFIADKKGLSKIIFLVCTPIIVLYYAFRLNVPFPYLPKFGTDFQYVTNAGPDAWVICLTSLVMLALFYRISTLLGGKAPALVNHISLNINSYYCVSYIFTIPAQTILLAFYGQLMNSMLIATIYSLIVIALCYFIIDFNEKKLHFHLVTLTQPKKAITYAFIWICTILVVIYSYPRIQEYATFWNEYLMP
jgi:hypothetical protein